MDQEAALYLDEKNEWSAPEPARPVRMLSDREEKLVLWLVVVNLVALLIAPIGGASVVEALIALFAN